MSFFLNENAVPAETPLSAADQVALQEGAMELQKLETLDEKVITVRRTENKDTRVRRVMARQAMFIAKQKNDPMYAKLVMHLEKAKELRTAIRNRYKSEARKSAKNVK